MSEYIEKAKLYTKIAELEELARNRYLDTPASSPCCERYRSQMCERTALKHFVADFPTVDAMEVKHGKWEHLGGDEWACTCCGNAITTEGSWEKPTYKFCYMCGAKMQEGQP